MSKMRAAQVSRPGGPLEIVEREIPQPAAGQVRIKIQACGVCHSDSMVKEGLWPGLQYPRIPGHEVIGTVDAVGAGVAQWKTGQRVGVGWHGGNCGYCDACGAGDFFACTVALQFTGISFDGGYAEYMVAPAIAVAVVPDDLPAADAAPLMCAGVTTYNALRNSGRGRAILRPSTALEDWDILAYSMPRRWVFAPWRSREVQTRKRSRESWARTTTSTANRPIQRRNFKSSAERR